MKTFEEAIHNCASEIAHEVMNRTTAFVSIREELAESDIETMGWTLAMIFGKDFCEVEDDLRKMVRENLTEELA